MKAIIRRASLCVASLVLGLFAAHARAQTTPAVQGTSIADPAVPVVITPAPAGSGFFVLNQDYTVLQHSTVDSSQNESCPAPSIFSTTNTAQRTLVTDLYNAYVSGADAPGLSLAVTAITPEVLCQTMKPFDYTGGVPAQSLAANDIEHASYYLVSAFGGSDADSLTVLNNLNNATVSSSNSFNGVLQASLGLNGQYTSIVPDVRSDFGLTAITELKTDTSPGYLWVYDPGTQNVYKILGPGGVPLPAVTSFIIPPQIDGGGSLLVLVNQDGLTASNISDPPQDTVPFTIIDLGQLRPLFATNPLHNTITLPFVQQIQATTPFYAMLGAAYNPIDHRIYAVVGGGTSVTSVVESVLSYDTLNPSAPTEKVVADVSDVPFTLDSYPQLALNAASGTMQILTSNPATVYSVGINGTGNTAVEVSGTTFPDSNFRPTYITANALQGETYIASANGQVDVLTRPTTLQGGLTITLTGSDLGYTSQEYDLKPLALWPLYDDSLGTAKLTITVTPDGGAPVTVATGHISDIGYPGSSFYTYTFPAPGRYTFVATAEASTLYPAVTSPPLYVYVGNTGVYPTAVTLTAPSTAPSTNGEATFNATVNLTGTTYAPTGQVYIQDQTGAEVANISLHKGVISNPLTLPVTIGDGVSTLTAVYSGDEQNQGSKSAGHDITVGTVTKVTPTFNLSLTSSKVVSGAKVNGTLITTSTLTTAPTGTITIYATPSKGSTSNAVATVQAAQTFSASGASFSFTAGTADTYSIFAGYGGDANYNNGVSSPASVVVTAVPVIATTLGLTTPASVVAGNTFNAVVKMQLASQSTIAPTGNIVLTAQLAGGSTMTLGTITPAQAMATGGYTLATSLPAAGTYTVVATYAGDSNFGASTQSSSITVTAAPLQVTSIGIVAPTTATPGVAFNVVVGFNVFGAFTTQPTGDITLTATFAGGSPTTIATVTPAQGMAPGGANVSVTLPNAGAYTLNANYAGDKLYAASTNTATVTVNGFATTLRITAANAQKVGTAFNAIVVLATTGTTAAPTGNVVITATPAVGSPVTIATITAASAFATRGASVPVTLNTAGSYTLTASYAGAGPYTGSSGAATVSVAGIATALSLRLNLASPVANSDFNVLETFTATGSTTAPTGSITLTMAVNGGTPQLVLTSDASAVYALPAQLSVLSGGPGTYVLTATYAGAGIYEPSSATVSFTIVISPSTLTLTGPSTGTVGTAVNFSLLLSTNLSGPSGNVTLSSTLNGAAGPSVTIDASAIDALAASVPLTFPTAGTYTLTASYPGDANTSQATSNSLAVTVAAYTGPPSFTLTRDSTDSEIHLGDSKTTPAIVSITLSSINGFSTPVVLSFAKANSPDTPLTKDNSDYIVIAVDHATQKPITSVTPLTTGAHVDLLIEYSDGTYARNENPFQNRMIYLGAGLGFLGLLGIRKRRKLCAGLMVVCVIVGAAGCALPPTTILVTATPTDKTTPPQTMQIDVAK
jgi:hypothetical protein